MPLRVCSDETLVPGGCRSKEPERRRVSHPARAREPPLGQKPTVTGKKEGGELARAFAFSLRLMSIFISVQRRVVKAVVACASAPHRSFARQAGSLHCLLRAQSTSSSFLSLSTTTSTTQRSTFRQRPEIIAQTCLALGPSSHSSIVVCCIVARPPSLGLRHQIHTHLSIRRVPPRSILRTQHRNDPACTARTHSRIVAVPGAGASAASHPLFAR